MSEQLARRSANPRRARGRRPAPARLIFLAGCGLVWLALLLLTAWAAAALYFDVPLKAARVPAVATYLGGIAALLSCILLFPDSFQNHFNRILSFV